MEKLTVELTVTEAAVLLAAMSLVVRETQNWRHSEDRKMLRGASESATAKLKAALNSIPADPSSPGLAPPT